MKFKIPNLSPRAHIIGPISTSSISFCLPWSNFISFSLFNIATSFLSGLFHMFFALHRTFFSRPLPSYSSQSVPLAKLLILQFSIKIFFLMFIYYWETEKDRAWAWEGQREGETQNLKEAPASELSAQSPEPDAGLKLTNCKIMTWAEVGGLTDWATQVPLVLSF